MGEERGDAGGGQEEGMWIDRNMILCMHAYIYIFVFFIRYEFYCSYSRIFHHSKVCYIFRIIYFLMKSCILCKYDTMCIYIHIYIYWYETSFIVEQYLYYSNVLRSEYFITRTVYGNHLKGSRHFLILFFFLLFFTLRRVSL